MGQGLAIGALDCHEVLGFSSRIRMRRLGETTIGRLHLVDPARQRQAQRDAPGGKPGRPLVRGAKAQCPQKIRRDRTCVWIDQNPATCCAARWAFTTVRSYPKVFDIKSY